MGGLNDVPEYYKCSVCKNYKELKEMCKVKTKIPFGSTPYKLVCKDCIKGVNT